MLTLHMTSTPQSLRDLYSSAAHILAAEKFRMSQSEAKLVSLLIGREDMLLRGVKCEPYGRSIPPGYSSCLRSEFRVVTPSN